MYVLTAIFLNFFENEFVRERQSDNCTKLRYIWQTARDTMLALFTNKNWHVLSISTKISDLE